MVVFSKEITMYFACKIERMKNYSFLLMLLLFGSFLMNAQPGPRYVNLNEGLGDVIIIDSTTELSRIAILKNHRNLHVIIDLPKIPVEFKDFVKIQSLTISAGGNISKLDEYFPNLKTLSIHRYAGKSIAAKKFQWDSLENLYISDAKNLKKMDAFTNCLSIKKIMIRGTPNLNRFPKFHKKNNIKELVIDHGITFRKNETKNYLKSIKRLSKLEKLTLANIYSLTEVPSFLPTSIQYLEINSWALHDYTTKIKSLKHLKKYPNLKFLKLYKIELAPVEESFSTLSLEYLYLNRLQDTKDISWIFTFKKIGQVSLRNCHTIQTLEANYNTAIDRIDINGASNLTSVNSLFQLDNLKSLEIRSCPKLLLPTTDVMYKIPHIMMAGNRYHLYRENGFWEKIEYY